MQDETPTAQSQRPLGSLISGLTQDMSTLVLEEAGLARTEISGKISQAVAGLVFFILAAVVMIGGFIILLDAAVVGLNHVFAPGLTPWLSEIIVGVVVLIVGLILLMIGRSQLRAKNLMPQKTITNVKRDRDLVKEQMT